MKKKIIKLAKIIFPLLLGVYLIIYTYNKFDETQLEELKGYFKNLKYEYLLISIVFALISHLSRSWRWNYLLEPLGYRLKFKNSIMSVLIAYMVNLLIPRSGEVTRAVLVNKYENIPLAKAMGTIITERIFDFVILALLCLIVIYLQFERLGGYLDYFSLKKTLGYLAILSFLLGVAFLILKKSKNQLIKKIKCFVKDLLEGLLSVLKMKKLRYFLFHTILIWVMYILMFYIAVFSLEEMSSVGLDAIISSFVVGGIAIAVTNGGFGAYPLFVAEMLLLYEVPFTVGTAFGWILWLLQFLFIVLFGGVSMILLPILNAKEEHIKTSITS